MCNARVIHATNFIYFYYEKFSRRCYILMAFLVLWADVKIRAGSSWPGDMRVHNGGSAGYILDVD